MSRCFTLTVTLVLLGLLTLCDTGRVQAQPSKAPQFTFSEELQEQEKELANNPYLLECKEARRRLASDPFRPRYHFVNPEGGLNDPNGLCYWQGRWHLFYQAFPKEDPRLHWGHAVSDDLVHWQDLPLALFPGPESNCFSGSIWLEEDRALACYHGVGAGTMIAVSTDPLLLNWEKLSGNAVIPMPQGDVPYHIYDPCLWKEGDSYYILTSHFQKIGETKVIRPAWFLFESHDLIHWDYVHQFVENDYFSQVFGDGACPYFWPIGEQSDVSKRRHILLHSCHTYGSAWLLGVYDRQAKKFFPESGEYWNRRGVTPCGIHAPSAFPDGQGGIVVINNMNHGRETPGWNQIMTLPYRMTLLENDEMGMAPVEAIHSLRDKEIAKNNIPLPANDEVVFDDIQGKSLEFRLVLSAAESSVVQMKFFRSPGNEEYTAVNYYPGRGVRHRAPGDMPRLLYGEPEDVIEIDASRSSEEPTSLRASESAGVRANADKTVELRIYVDNSVIEVFANNRQLIAERVYPSREDSCGFSIESRGRDALIKEMSVWSMKGIFDEAGN
ncbi:MAG: glycoside hydrolase family 32 protein [Planctomycetia bacterium]|nr:glycoside hydrolase family 32 protein [Planctomycetia bacterium]